MNGQSDNAGKMSPEVAKAEVGVVGGDRKWYVPRCGLVFYIMAFLGCFCAFLLRVSISVTIVAMVNQTAITSTDELTNVSSDEVTGQCPRDPALERGERGEFVWDRAQQGALLAAFYYGHEITQVIIILYSENSPSSSCYSIQKNGRLTPFCNAFVIRISYNCCTGVNRQKEFNNLWNTESSAP